MIYLTSCIYVIMSYNKHSLAFYHRSFFSYIYIYVCVCVCLHVYISLLMMSSMTMVFHVVSRTFLLKCVVSTFSFFSF